MAKILLIDIETAPILGYVWGLWENNLALNQIEKDWHIMSWCAKWLDEDVLFYMDQRDQKNIENDKKILEVIWHLLDEADVLITQNGKKFDSRKLNARFIINGMKPPSTYKHLDTKQIAQKYFAFTSHKLEYMSEKLNTKYKKLKHEKYPGFELWKECMKGNIEAWDEMEKYNRHDVLALEELYKKIIPWDNSFNPNIYHGENNTVCTCGGTMFIKNGFRYTNAGKYQKHCCKKCGAEFLDKHNELEEMKRLTLKKR